MGPYRTPAEMPEEEYAEMSEKELSLRVWRMVVTTIMGIVALLVAYNVFATIHADNTAILKAQIESTPMARDAAHERYLEAKALSDKAMFEQMTKAQK